MTEQSTDWHRQRSCARKVRYSLDAAQRAIWAMSDKCGAVLERYECQYCGGWHIGNGRKLLLEIKIVRSK